MSFQLAYIELQVANSIYEIAEKHLENNCLISYFKSENNLWTGTVKTSQNYEVEAKLKGGLVNNITCDCNDYTKDKPCVHITTLLIQLRRDLLNAEQATPTKTVSKQKSKVKISPLLEQVSKDDLSTFIIQYSRKNKGFSNELKAFLSSSMSDAMDTSYYSQLLLSAMRLNRKKDNSISVKGASHIKVIIEELWFQSQDKIAAKKYTEATAILKALSLQLPIIIDKILNDSYFIKLFEKVIKAFNSYPQNLVSPELNDDIFTFLNEEVSINNIMNNNLERPFLETILEMANTKEKKNTLSTTLEEAKLNSAKWTKRNNINLILLELKLAQLEDKKDKAEALIQQHLTHADILFHVIDDATKNRNWKQVRKFSEIGLKQNFNLSLNKVLHQHLYKEANIQKDKKRIQKYGELLFLSEYELAYLVKIVESFPEEKRNDYLKKLLPRVLKNPFHTNKKEAVAEIYLQLEQSEELLKYIKEIKSLDLLQLVTERLLPAQKKALNQLYIELISDYLSFHLGPVPVLRIRKILIHLRKLGAHDMVHRITDALAKDFSERSSLLHELEIL